MSEEKRFYVRYTGPGVAVVRNAGKFMPGTGAYLGEADARALVGREDFVVDGLGDEPVARAAPPPPAPPAPAPPAPAPPAPAPAPPAPAPAATAPPPAAPELARASFTWRSERTQCDTRLSRWGHAGQPILVIPPEGGDADEIERMQLVAALQPLIAAGQIKVYSCDGVAGRALVAEEGAPQHRMWLLHMFEEYVAREVVPAIRADGVGDQATVIAAGAAIGAMLAAALVCRYPEIFSHALCVSGSYQLERLLKTTEVTDDLLAASPLHLVPRLGEGPALDRLRTRFVLFAAGEGPDEDIGESWALAHALGDKHVPNRVDPWGKEEHPGWQTWGRMFSRYLAEWTGPSQP